MSEPYHTPPEMSAELLTFAEMVAINGKDRTNTLHHDALARDPRRWCEALKRVLRDIDAQIAQKKATLEASQADAQIAQAEGRPGAWTAHNRQRSRVEDWRGRTLKVRQLYQERYDSLRQNATDMEKGHRKMCPKVHRWQRVEVPKDADPFDAPEHFPESPEGWRPQQRREGAWQPFAASPTTETLFWRRMLERDL